MRDCKNCKHLIMFDYKNRSYSCESGECEFDPEEQEPKIGKWVHREDMDYLDKIGVTHNHFMCNKCGLIHDFIDGHTSQYNYCPQCGAKMAETEVDNGEID